MTTKEEKISTLVSRISVSLPPDLLAELDSMVESRGYGSRSQAIGEMVNFQLAEHKRIAWKRGHGRHPHATL